MTLTEYIDIHYTVEPVSGGRQIKVAGQCPFCLHESADLRLYVNVETQLGKCFHCDKGFNAVQFVMAAENCSYSKARVILAEGEEGWAKGKPPESRGKTFTPLFPPLVEVAERSEVAAYLKGRGLSDWLIKSYCLKYCEHDTEFDGRVYRTAGRVIIPIFDGAGVVAGWIGRDVTGKAKLKYLFQPGFDAGRHLYNIWNIDPAKKYVLICEGAFDVYGWLRGGVQNAIGTFGKKITPFQEAQIRALAPQVVYIAWDGDAIDKSNDFAAKYGHAYNIRIVGMGAKDADEMSKAEMLEALQSAEGFKWGKKILDLLHRS
jgi:DNA primase